MHPHLSPDTEWLLEKIMPFIIGTLEELTFTMLGAGAAVVVTDVPEPVVTDVPEPEVTTLVPEVATLVDPEYPPLPLE